VNDYKQTPPTPSFQEGTPGSTHGGPERGGTGASAAPAQPVNRDPQTSVLDRWCRAHEVDNLFVVDGGPFPTGTGANPTLTIMANAWRVADHIAAGGGR
jgi:hypothetical protein